MTTNALTKYMQARYGCTGELEIIGEHGRLMIFQSPVCGKLIAHCVGGQWLVFTFHESVNW